MTKLAEAIASTVQAAQQHDGAKLGTSIVDIVSNGVGLLGKLFGF
ncbi:beta-class phenol-soluble modulin [Staphylococcus simiae]|uniref:Anti protein (Phenol soluble modulin) n=1 Tax=Staphylococcus simiae CCM 7213 = CCUG 51256 TaxID=911238 RepID=G5JLK3_9STAP|nr:beta-class phenol-soluble modulin [Staphylococcus simiae]EHJ06935.1 anti protein (phenol soluble modulin) [Staphylococcus simiae CCM 7213 = CCUG 51256]PNZ11958.1 beta-class phenol-soluble modulin [Staphylococcus simiae]SNV68665.1 antibacterial protein [Staphylococcus simiae]